MSQQSLLQLAKQGNTDAIASTINYLLKDQNINATASIDNNCLKIILESQEIINQESLLPFVHKLVLKLEIKTIDSLKIYAIQAGENLPLWTTSIPLNLDKNKLKNQDQQKQTNHKVHFNKYPMWLPYPSSLWRTLLLTIVGLPLAQVVVLGVLLIFIGFATSQLSAGSYFIIALGILLLLVSVLIISFFHSIAKRFIKKIFPKYNILKYSNNLWEGLYGTIIISISSLIILTIFAQLSFYDCQSLYNRSNDVWACAGRYTGKFAKITVDSIQKQDFMNKPWFSIWLIIVVFLYQIEFIIKSQLISKIKARKVVIK